MKPLLFFPDPDNSDMITNQQLIKKFEKLNLDEKPEMSKN